MSLITMADLEKHFPELPDVLAVLEAAGVKAEKINPFNLAENEYHLATAADAILDHLDDERDDETADAIDDLRECADKHRANRDGNFWGGMAKVVEGQGDYTALARFADPSGGGMVFE